MTQILDLYPGNKFNFKRWNGRCKFVLVNDIKFLFQFQLKNILREKHISPLFQGTQVEGHDFALFI